MLVNMVINRFLEIVERERVLTLHLCGPMVRDQGEQISSVIFIFNLAPPSSKLLAISVSKASMSILDTVFYYKSSNLFKEQMRPQST
jgi:hypothetical protein